MKKKSDKVNIAFYGKWASTEVDSFDFKYLSSVAEKAAKRSEKKVKNKKIIQFSVFSFQFSVFSFQFSVN